MFVKQTYKADFVCYGKIIIELKAVSALDDAHRSQVYNYLHATGFKLGLLYNFGCSDELEKERVKAEKEENVNIFPVNLDNIGGSNEEVNE